MSVFGPACPSRSKLEPSHELDVARRTYAAIPGTELGIANSGIEVLTASIPGAGEIVHIGCIERFATQQEGYTLGIAAGIGFTRAWDNLGLSLEGAAHRGSGGELS